MYRHKPTTPLEEKLMRMHPTRYSTVEPPKSEPSGLSPKLQKRLRDFVRSAELPETSLRSPRSPRSPRLARSPSSPRLARSPPRSAPEEVVSEEEYEVNQPPASSPMAHRLHRPLRPLRPFRR